MNLSYKVKVLHLLNYSHFYNIVTGSIKRISKTYSGRNWTSVAVKISQLWAVKVNITNLSPQVKVLYAIAF